MEKPWGRPFLVTMYPTTLKKNNSITFVLLLKFFRIAILAVPKLADKSESDQLI